MKRTKIFEELDELRSHVATAPSYHQELETLVNLLGCCYRHMTDAQLREFLRDPEVLDIKKLAACWLEIKNHESARIAAAGDVTNPTDS